MARLDGQEFDEFDDRTLDAPYRDFGWWLISDQYRAYRDQCSQDEVPSCLLDVVLVWLRHGDAVSVCGNFETYLITVIQIVDEWGASGRSEHVGPLTAWAFTEDYEGAGLSLRGDLGGDSLPVVHPALSRSVFDAVLGATRFRRQSTYRK